MRKKVTIKKILIVLFLLFALGFGFFIYDVNSNNFQTIANFADNFMRPLIGNIATIKLEEIVFNFQDTIKRIEYQIKPSGELQNLVNVDLVWKQIKSKGKIFKTSVYYPDTARPYAYVNLVKVDMQKVNIGAVAGIREPASEVGKPGPGVIPQNVLQNGKLIAAFNGGFQYRDGQYGMAVGGDVYLPLKTGLASFLVDKKYRASIVEDDGQIDPNNYLLVRQNGEILIRNGLIIPSSSDKAASLWGRSVTSNMYTWRSGVGIDSNGNLIYAVGPSLVPQTLAKALKAGGAENAMQLDINPFWVRFSTFKYLGSGQYKHQSLFPKMYDGGKDFLTGDKKDFFYLYLKNNGLSTLN